MPCKTAGSLTFQCWNLTHLSSPSSDRKHFQSVITYHKQSSSITNHPPFSCKKSRKWLVHAAFKKHWKTRRRKTESEPSCCKSGQYGCWSASSFIRTGWTCTLKEVQRAALKAFGGEDVFASLLTGYGKSLVKQNTTLQLCHQAATASDVALHTISKPSAVATCFNWQ